MNKTNKAWSNSQMRAVLFMNMVVLVFLAIWLVGQLVSAPAMAQQVGAVDGFGGMSGRIAQQLEAQQQTNQKLDELINLLKTGRAKVQIVVDGGGDAGNK